MTETYWCVRVYLNGEAVETVRDQAGFGSWIENNRRYRPGCAKFVNGQLLNEEDRGYLSLAECSEISRLLVSEMARRKLPAPVGMSFQPGSLGDPARVRYPDDTPRKSFDIRAISRKLDRESDALVDQAVPSPLSQATIG